MQTQLQLEREKKMNSRYKFAPLKLLHDSHKTYYPKSNSCMSVCCMYVCMYKCKVCA